MTTRRDRIEAALIGAYVADAAALGFHWLYDADRVAALAPSGLAFRAPDPADFEGFKGVFVHHGKHAGDLSQYGVQMQVMVQSVIAKGAFDLTDYQDRFAATFGPGGSWIGYMDKATKGTLANLAADRRTPSGFDDDQVPAVSKLPPLMALTAVTDSDVDAAVTATSANETARSHARPLAAMLRAAYDGGDRAACLDAAVAAAEGDAADAVQSGLLSAEPDTAVFAGEVGRACPLPQALPVMIHIVARADSYRDAIERNILAGGDNCGRAPCLGAIFGVWHGLGNRGIPLNWLAKLKDLPELSAEIEALCQRRP
jgi:ADP-ribosylglycohydrolase